MKAIGENKKIWRMIEEILPDGDGRKKILADIHLNEFYDGEIWASININGNNYIMEESRLRIFVEKCNELFEKRNKPK